MEYLYFINFGCMIFSAWVAVGCFGDGLTKAGYLNIFASALNGAVFANHFL